jgi:GTP diphosphokinase / guanosine-3',5'-bis(diphosphate) 3'-diphosphatase
LRFVISVRDRSHLDQVLKNLRRTASVLTAERMLPVGTNVMVA